MADVFLSYKSEDRALVATLARALEREGLKVWWDRKIAAGGGWREVIVSELRKSKVVIAAWSRRTEDVQAASWVLNEVDEAARLGKPLIPLLMEPCEAPFGYRHVQAADLSDWRGEPHHPEWREVQASVRAALAGRRIAPVAMKSAHRRAPRKNGGDWLAHLVVFATISGGAYALVREAPRAPQIAEQAQAEPTPQSAVVEQAEAQPVSAEPAWERRPQRRRWRRDRVAAASPLEAEVVTFIGRDNVRGVFRRMRGDHWLEQNNEAGRAGYYHVTRVGASDLEMFDEERGLYALIDFESGQISIKSRGEEHYHARYRIAAPAAPGRSRAD